MISPAKDCGALKAPTNGSLSGNLTTYPQVIKFICDEGFILRGSKVRQCMSNGNWSGDKTYCEGKKGDVWKVANIIIIHIDLFIIWSFDIIIYLFGNWSGNDTFSVGEEKDLKRYKFI